MLLVRIKITILTINIATYAIIAVLIITKKNVSNISIIERSIVIPSITGGPNLNTAKENIKRLIKRKINVATYIPKIKVSEEIAFPIATKINAANIK
jgi:hypothetical protein